MTREGRELTAGEREWLILGLRTVATGEAWGGGRWVDTGTGLIEPRDSLVDPRPLLDQVDSLRVVGRCECGDPRCHTIRFQHYERGKSVAIVSHSTDDGRLLVIHVHEQTGLLAELEIV